MHDAGDLSQQTLQTGDVTFSLLEAYNRLKTRNTPLAARLLEEAEWGIEFILKNRYGDGYRASSMGLLIWQDGILNTMDDIHSVRVSKHGIRQFPVRRIRSICGNDHKSGPYATRASAKGSGGRLCFCYRKIRKERVSTYSNRCTNIATTPPRANIWQPYLVCQYALQAHGKAYYAEKAAETIQYVLACQRTEPLQDPEKTCGFFYRDQSGKSIVHYIHQSREQVYMQAMTLLCETQKQHPDYQKWVNSIQLYGNYLKGLMKYTRPYGMIPSGVYHAEEYSDSASFYALHLFPPANARQLYTEQVKRGVKLDKEHYLKRFPVWFSIFNGNTAIHLSTGKSAAICGNFLKDEELLNIGREQLYWTVGRNPFGQSLIYGEGYNYPQMNSFSSGEMTGEMPVGIRTLGNDDIPYWPQTNNACYKEVWVTSAGKWLSLIAEY
jgi:hypothetical protein